MYRHDRISSGSTVSSVVSSFSRKAKESAKENSSSKLPRGLSGVEVKESAKENRSSKLPRGPSVPKELSGVRVKDLSNVVTKPKYTVTQHAVTRTSSVLSEQSIKPENTSHSCSRQGSLSHAFSNSTSSSISNSTSNSLNSTDGTDSDIATSDVALTVAPVSAAAIVTTNITNVSHPADDSNRNITDSTLSEKVTSPKFVNPEQSGYVGFANLPNQVHRKSVKKGFEFTLMVVGESGLGKSTLVNSLFLTDLYPERHILNAQEKIQQTVKIDASTVEIEERGVKLRLTVVDTPGFGDSLNSVDCFKPIIQYVDDQFECYLQDESGLNRRHIIDNRVHCCFYFINPSGHGLRPLDIAFMRAVHHKVNIVPVLAKADTLVKKEVLDLKKKIMHQVEQFGISLYPLPDCDDDEDEDYKEQCKQLKEAVPFAVVGSNTIIEVKGKKVRGRMYPWGVVEVENPDHCDFIKLRTMLITHMQDLQEVTQEVHYENFRAERLATGGTVPPKRTSRSQPPRSSDTVDSREQALQEKEKELRRMQEMVAKMQAEMDAQKSGAQQNGARSHNV